MSLATVPKNISKDAVFPIYFLSSLCITFPLLTFLYKILMTAFRRWERPNEADLPRFHRDCMRVYASMFRGVVDALLAATVTSLEALRSRIMDDDFTTPLLAADLCLNIPNITLDPSLDQMQATVLELTKETLHMLLGLTMWGLRTEPVSATSAGNSFSLVFQRMVSSPDLILVRYTPGICYCINYLGPRENAVFHSYCSCFKSKMTASQHSVFLS